MIYPDGLDALRFKLLSEQNTLAIIGDIGIAMGDYISEAFAILKTMGNPDITIEIDSGGGDAKIGLYIYDCIRLYPGKTTGLVIFRANSMGAIILQACDIRRCSIHSTILIHCILHTIKIVNFKLNDANHVNELIVDCNISQEKTEAILISKTKRSKGKIQSEMKKDKPMTAQQALDFGLIDEII
ncbi:hypothetical protein GW933_00005 [Candidatus Falkowbacteria bacterium]|uniref:ATP-dependent Clp protease proteolytic subunit n=1 Tax=Candidatus Buchananbacteria bacterium CG10_big_fil_rev_8_21_14_0_10_33_19 TaxID=1974525 RepID=A0A2H0W2Q3_9BACT|nr:hypothetical protein [Candidatus Falkowbacteria bacterium]PIS05649.1 MAG: hypothetical protein COT80_02625 [Candidatus Buchananbacteria bacterium CG10_big_fil_rev_8_21_14_0_10_33_19]